MHFPDRFTLPFSSTSCSNRIIKFSGDSFKIQDDTHRQPVPDHQSTDKTHHEYFRMRFHFNAMRKRLMTVYSIIPLHITDSTLLFSIKYSDVV